jgi:hypothetical protein
MAIKSRDVLFIRGVVYRITGFSGLIGVYVLQIVGLFYEPVVA